MSPFWAHLMEKRKNVHNRYCMKINMKCLALFSSMNQIKEYLKPEFSFEELDKLVPKGTNSGREYALKEVRPKSARRKYSRGVLPVGALGAFKFLDYKIAYKKNDNEFAEKMNKKNIIQKK